MIDVTINTNLGRLEIELMPAIVNGAPLIAASIKHNFLVPTVKAGVTEVETLISALQNAVDSAKRAKKDLGL